MINYRDIREKKVLDAFNKNENDGILAEKPSRKEVKRALRARKHNELLKQQKKNKKEKKRKEQLFIGSELRVQRYKIEQKKKNRNIETIEIRKKVA